MNQGPNRDIFITVSPIITKEKYFYWVHNL